MAENEIRLAPHSSIQFIRFSFNIETSPRFSRNFIEHQKPNSAEGLARTELRPGWNDDDVDADPPFVAAGEDITYDISKQKALEPFLNNWTPLPYLSVLPYKNNEGQEKLGPTNWCRILVSEDKTLGSCFTHKVIIAFDTEIVKPAPNRPYVGLSPDDAQNEREFALASRFSDIAWFLSDRIKEPGSSDINLQDWVDLWIDDLLVRFLKVQKRRQELRLDDRYLLEHAARYITFLQFLALVVKPPRVKLIDTYSANPTLKPVNVDLVLDIGNSRTCGMLIETLPNQSSIDLGNSYILQLRDLTSPDLLYDKPFESDVQLSQACFGNDHLSKASMRSRAFFWPSLVRVGPEAARFREAAQGTEGASGMSSPKRYLCDVEAVNQEWRFQADDYKSERDPPLIDRVARRFMNSRGDVLRQVAAEKRFYERLSTLNDRTELEKSANRLSYSRSSFFTLMLAEILIQTLSLINNPEIRAKRPERDTPRRLTRIILTMPTAMPVREQWILRSRAQAAIKLVWDLMGWTETPPPGVPEPLVHASWDEASCAQFVYLYAEIMQKFGGNITEYIKLTGSYRPFVEVEKQQVPAGPVQPSLRIASIDVGGGTTDLMITTYYVEKDYALVPCQTFREGFRIAGEDILKEIIEKIVIPAFQRALKTAGLAKAPEFLTYRLGSDRANMAEQDKHLRRQYVLRVLKPAALALLALYERSARKGETTPALMTISELVASIDGKAMPLEGRIADYLKIAIQQEGLHDFRIEDIVIPIDFSNIAIAINNTLDNLFSNIASAIRHYDCDVVLMSGRPTSLPATIDLFVNKLAVSPDRVVPLAHYPPGPWFPFGGSARIPIGDPKTATVVGGMLCALAERQITNFTMQTHRLAMRSTANYIGIMEADGKLRAAKVLFQNDGSLQSQSAQVDWFAPMPIGFRQLQSDRWVATALYKIKLLPVPNLNFSRPVTIELERELPEELADYEDKNFSLEEAKKEELRITSATTREGTNVKHSFALMLDTLRDDNGYWLDSGILNVY